MNKNKILFPLVSRIVGFVIWLLVNNNKTIFMIHCKILKFKRPANKKCTRTYKHRKRTNLRLSSGNCGSVGFGWLVVWLFESPLNKKHFDTDKTPKINLLESCTFRYHLYSWLYSLRSLVLFLFELQTFICYFLVEFNIIFNHVHYGPITWSLNHKICCSFFQKALFSLAICI